MVDRLLERIRTTDKQMLTKIEREVEDLGESVKACKDEARLKRLQRGLKQAQKNLETLRAMMDS